ncbi:MAG: 23S rRNA (pseudouridine(1915)-N(3))-methyltransferase RlmH [Eubacteriales bacterium]|nr:23S rRNA (pseudouridine(1915)-N(3))-methyltransferase RlmH [Eubacteriales bacterium]MDD4390397.1 23S rRNA (pseudouridine(1915)-N(3))-methyltransferase RlmH [Eubacteriales bacterium]
MNIDVICIGKLKEKYWTDATGEYIKRLSKYCTIQIKELKEARLPDNAGQAEENAVRKQEGEAILSGLKKGCYVITLEIDGEPLSSEQLAAKIEQLTAFEGRSRIAFIIGGSLGLSQEVCERSDFSLSFSAMTFPHQMMRVILLEQIYRAFKIIKNEAYHK